MPRASLSKNRILSNSVAGVLAFLSWPAATYAQLVILTISLSPNPPRQCETLTIQWGETDLDSPLRVNLIAQPTLKAGLAQTLFQTIVNVPTRSAEWLVSATSGASVLVEVVGKGPSDLQIQGVRTAFQVLPGESFCSTTSNPSPQDPMPTLSVSSTPGNTLPTPSLTPPPAPSATSTYLDNATLNNPAGMTSTSSSFVDDSMHRMVTSMSTSSAPSTTGSSTSHLTAGGGVGLGVGTTVAAICLVLALVLYVKRRRRHRPPPAPVNPLTLSQSTAHTRSRNRGNSMSRRNSKLKIHILSSDADTKDREREETRGNARDRHEFIPRRSFFHALKLKNGARYPCASIPSPSRGYPRGRPS